MALLLLIPLWLRLPWLAPSTPLLGAVKNHANPERNGLQRSESGDGGAA